MTWFQKRCWVVVPGRRKKQHRKRKTKRKENITNDVGPRAGGVKQHKRNQPVEVSLCQTVCCTYYIKCIFKPYYPCNPHRPSAEPSIHSYVFPQKKIWTPIHSYVFQFIRMSSKKKSEPQFIRISSNSFVYLLPQKKLRRSSFVYLPIHSYVLRTQNPNPPILNMYSKIENLQGPKRRWFQY